MHFAGTFQQTDRLWREFQHHGQCISIADRVSAPRTATDEFKQTILLKQAQKLQDNTHMHHSSSLYVTFRDPSINTYIEYTHLKSQRYKKRVVYPYHEKVSLRSCQWLSIRSLRCVGSGSGSSCWVNLKVWLDSKSSDLRRGIALAKTFAVFEGAERMRQVHTRPKRVDPKFQCSPLSQAKKK